MCGIVVQNIAHNFNFEFALNLISNILAQTRVLCYNKCVWKTEISEHVQYFRLEAF